MKITYLAQLRANSWGYANQDACATGDGRWDDRMGYLFVVADGSGLQFPVARVAVDSVCASYYQNDASDRLAALRQSFEAANQTVRSARPDDSCRATCVAVVLHNNCLHIGHVGDCRAYLFRSNELHQVTEDQTFVAKLIQSGQITEEEARRAPLGRAGPYVFIGDDLLRANFSTERLQVGDVILLCTKGLAGWLHEYDIDIANILRSHSGPDLASKLIEYASSEHQGDMTVVLITLTMLD